MCCLIPEKVFCYMNRYKYRLEWKCLEGIIEFSAYSFSVKGDVNYARLCYKIITINKLIGNESQINGRVYM
jgi:hypothetical protein